MHDIAKLRKIIIAVSFLVYLIAIPPFIRGQMLAGHDAKSHIIYLKVFTDALAQGQFPVRWIEWVLPGHNLPLFNFYQPLFYYISSIPHFLGLNILDSLYLTVVFLWLFSGITVYLFVKNITRNSLAGLTASLLYVFAPYHILDVFVRSAYPELSALFFVPGLFWALERIYATQKLRYAGFLSLFFAGTAVSHPPTLIIFSFAFVLYFLYLAWEKYHKSKESLKLFLKIILSVTLGFGISSFFLIPAFVQQNLINHGLLSSGYLNFQNHFVCLFQLIDPNWGFGVSQFGCTDDISYQVGILNWIIILIFIGILIVGRKIKNKYEFNSLGIVFLSIALIGMYMTTSFSISFWEGIPYISYIQFPWRFLSVVIFSIAILGGILFTYLKSESQKIVMFIGIIIAIPILIHGYLNPGAYLPKDFAGQENQDFYSQVKEEPEKGYLPKAVQVLPEQAQVPESQLKFSKSKLTPKVIKNNFSYKEYTFNLTEADKAQVFVHYFPGWKFYVNGKIVTPYYSNMYGFVFLDVPSGESVLIVKFEGEVITTFSNAISLISLLISVLIIMGLNRNHLRVLKLSRT